MYIPHWPDCSVLLNWKTLARPLTGWMFKNDVIFRDRVPLGIRMLSLPSLGTFLFSIYLSHRVIYLL